MNPESCFPSTIAGTQPVSLTSPLLKLFVIVISRVFPTARLVRPLLGEYCRSELVSENFSFETVRELAGALEIGVDEVVGSSRPQFRVEDVDVEDWALLVADGRLLNDESPLLCRELLARVSILGMLILECSVCFVSHSPGFFSVVLVDKRRRFTILPHKLQHPLELTLQFTWEAATGQFAPSNATDASRLPYFLERRPTTTSALLCKKAYVAALEYVCKQ